MPNLLNEFYRVNDLWSISIHTVDFRPGQITWLFLCYYGLAKCAKLFATHTHRNFKLRANIVFVKRKQQNVNVFKINASFVRLSYTRLTIEISGNNTHTQIQKFSVKHKPFWVIWRITELKRYANAYVNGICLSTRPSRVAKIIVIIIIISRATKFIQARLVRQN